MDKLFGCLIYLIIGMVIAYFFYYTFIAPVFNGWIGF